MGVTRCVSGDTNGQISKWTMWVDGVCVFLGVPRNIWNCWLVANRCGKHDAKNSPFRMFRKLRHLEITQNTNAAYRGENFVTGGLSNRSQKRWPFSGTQVPWRVSSHLGHPNIFVNFTRLVDFFPRYFCLLSAVRFTMIPQVRLWHRMRGRLAIDGF
jgi:hypothetical protein